MTKQNLKLNSRKETMLLYLNSSNLSMGYPKITFQEDQVINSCETGQASWGNYVEGQAEAAKEILQTTLITPSSPPMKVNCGLG